MTSAIAAIFAGCKQLGIDEDGRRAIYARVTGKPRLTLMSPAEKEAVVTELRRLGFQPNAGATKSKGLQGKYAKKLQALWIAGWNLGIVRDRRDAALLAFVHRQTGLDHVRFLHHADDARAAIEALKAWVRREADLPDLWRPVSKLDAWRNDPAVQVVFAQWEILVRLGAAPAASIYDWSGNPGRMFPFVNADRTVLAEMQKRLGRLIRAAKKGGA